MDLENIQKRIVILTEESRLKKSFKAVVVGTLISMVTNAFGEEAEDRIIVTASRSEQALSQISASATIIGGDEIEAKNYSFVSEYLSEVVGVNVVKDSELGGSASIFIRGAASGQTLVLINGARVNDMTSPDNAFSDGNLPTHMIERIEVVRGPQSLAYGSAAIGGVINIITKRPHSEQKSSIGLETGSFNTHKIDASTSGHLGNVSYLLGIFGLSSDGYSFADVDASEDEEADGFNQWQGLLSTDYDYSKSGTVKLSIISNNADYDIDAGPGADDPNNTSIAKRKLYSLAISDSFFDASWQPSLQISHMDMSRSNSDKPDTLNPQSESESSYIGQRQSVALINTFALAKLGLVIGGEFVQEIAKSSYSSPTFSSSFERKSTNTQSLFASGDYAFSENLFLDLGLRYDKFAYYGDQRTYKLGSRILIFDGLTTFRLSQGSGFKSPSLFQLYSDSGSLSLRPETSFSNEISLEQSLGEYGVLAVTYFEQDFKNLIDYDPETLKYININRAESKGIETQLHLNIEEDIGASLNFTQLEAIDQETKEQLPRRPKQESSISLYYTGSKIQGAVTWHAKSLLEGNAFSSDTLNSDNVSANLNYQINPMIRSWVRLENIGNAKRPYLSGYTRKPFSIYAGLRATIK